MGCGRKAKGAGPTAPGVDLTSSYTSAGMVQDVEKLNCVVFLAVYKPAKAFWIKYEPHVAQLLCLVALCITGLAFGQETGFGSKPSATKQGAQISIRFTVRAPTDVEVAALNAQDQVVRHLADGRLSAENLPPAPLKKGLEQEILWNGQGDWGLPVGPGPFKVRVRLGLQARFGGLVGDSPNFPAILTARFAAVCTPTPSKGICTC